LTYEGVPGLVETREEHGETTLVVDPARVREACLHLRDAEGFSFLSDITATDYVGWGERGVAGYYGTDAGRDLNAPSGFGTSVASQAYSRLPRPKPKRFSVNYHLLALRDGAPRIRVQVWVDDGETLDSVVSVWPTADWHEREAWDLMGIRFEGHPNMTRILMEDDWEGHPLRKDYPVGGEPVRFSGEE
jgi:NADH:ubiquinone oxidoreductase subunit C